jgi:hypothetical protein
MYFSPDGKSAIVVAEALHRLDFRDPKTMADAVRDRRAAVRRHQPRRLLAGRPLRHVHLRVRRFGGPIDLQARKVEGYLKLSMPATRFSEKDPIDPLANEVQQEEGHAAGYPRFAGRQAFYIADMDADGVHIVDAPFTKVGFIRPALARTACTRAATAPSCMWPTAARTRSTASRKARAA